MSDLVYRVIFSNQDQVYALYARQLGESDMYGFLEIQDLILEASLSYTPSEKLPSEDESMLRLEDEFEVELEDNALDQEVIPSDLDALGQELGQSIGKPLKDIFKDVKRVYIPSQAVIRIDELTWDRRVHSKVRSMKDPHQAKVTHLRVKIEEDKP